MDAQQQLSIARAAYAAATAAHNRDPRAAHDPQIRDAHLARRMAALDAYEAAQAAYAAAEGAEATYEIDHLLAALRAAHRAPRDDSSRGA